MELHGPNREFPNFPFLSSNHMPIAFLNTMSFNSMNQQTPMVCVKPKRVGDNPRTPASPTTTPPGPDPVAGDRTGGKGAGPPCIHVDGRPVPEVCLRGPGGKGNREEEAPKPETHDEAPPFYSFPSWASPEIQKYLDPKLFPLLKACALCKDCHEWDGVTPPICPKRNPFSSQKGKESKTTPAVALPPNCGKIANPTKSVGEEKGPESPKFPQTTQFCSDLSSSQFHVGKGVENESMDLPGPGPTKNRAPLHQVVSEGTKVGKSVGKTPQICRPSTSPVNLDFRSNLGTVREGEFWPLHEGPIRPSNTPREGFEEAHKGGYPTTVSVRVSPPLQESDHTAAPIRDHTGAQAIFAQDNCPKQSPNRPSTFQPKNWPTRPFSPSKEKGFYGNNLSFSPGKLIISPPAVAIISSKNAIEVAAPNPNSQDYPRPKEKLGEVANFATQGNLASQISFSDP